MADLGSAAKPGPQGNEPPPPSPQGRVQELRVTGNLMTLQAGLYCVFPKPGSPPADSRTGLPCVRISCAPAFVARAQGAEITSFNGSEWLTREGDGAMVRVTGEPAQIMVTVYQAAGGADPAPQLQVVQLSTNASAATEAPRPRGGAPVPLEPSPGQMLAHIQLRGDVLGPLGAWCGEAGTKAAIEGFSVRPPEGFDNDELEYQAVLGRGWLSPWMKGGEFCGSRGMALPVLGLRIRLVGPKAAAWDCLCSARFADGTEVGPLPAGEACEAESLAAMESFRVDITPAGAPKPAAKPTPKAGAAAKKPAKAPVTKKKR